MSTSRFSRLTSRLVATAAISAALCAIPATSASAAEPSQVDGKFLSDTRYGILWADAAGKLGVEKAANPAVAKLATDTRQAQTQLGSKVDGIASRLQVTLPTQIRPVGQGFLTSLQSKSGADFDRAWTELQINGYAMAVTGDTMAVAKATDPEVKALAQQRLSIDTKYLAQSRAVAKTVGANVPKTVNTGQGPASAPNPLYPMLAVALGAALAIVASVRLARQR